jgi:hypothetical protein
MFRGVNTGYLESLGNEAVPLHVPIQSLTVSATMHEDFFRTTQLFGRDQTWQNTDHLPYFADLYRDLKLLKNNRAPDAQLRFRELFREYREAVGKEPAVFQERLRNHLASERQDSFRPWFIDSVLPKRVAVLLKGLRHRIRRMPVYRTAIEAVGFRSIAD